MFQYCYPPNQAHTLTSERQNSAADIFVRAIGHSILQHGYLFEQERNSYVLHFLLSGKGSVMGETVSAPIGFLFTPECTQQYVVSKDPADPLWEQYWVIFGGKKVPEQLASAGFRCTPGTFEIPYHSRLNHIFRMLFQYEAYQDSDDHFLLLSLLWRIFSTHSYYQQNGSSSPPVRNSYVQSAMRFIHEHYHLKIDEACIAESVHISAKYLYKLFVSELGVSPIQYLNRYRIQCAKNILETQSISIREISRTVGFSDPEYFCHVFQKYTGGQSPSAYRRASQFF